MSQGLVKHNGNWKLEKLRMSAGSSGLLRLLNAFKAAAMLEGLFSRTEPRVLWWPEIKVGEMKQRTCS